MLQTDKQLSSKIHFEAITFLYIRKNIYHSFSLQNYFLSNTPKLVQLDIKKYTDAPALGYLHKVVQIVNNWGHLCTLDIFLV